MTAPGGMVRNARVADPADDRHLRHGLSPVVLVPGVLALLPSYAGLNDPVAELRAACRAAVSSLTGPVRVVADASGRRVAEHLLGEAGLPVSGGAGGDDGDPASYLVVANGSACRGEKAPGHLDDRSLGFDDALAAALRRPDPTALAATDEALAEQLWVGHAAGFRALAGLLHGAGPGQVDFAADPFGVQYWVMRWTCGS